MRKKLIFFICLAVCLQTIAFAQMQGVITSSTEREVSSIEPVVNTIKVKKYSDNVIITLCKDNTTGCYCFVKTETGTTSVNYGILPSNFVVYDFKILGENIYFCGQYNINNTANGFLAKISYNALFAGGNFDYDEIPQTSVVYEIEVYYNKITESDDIVALGTNSTSTMYYCINYNTSLSLSNYNLFNTQRVLQSITQTENYIGIVASYPATNEFEIIRFLKNSLYTNQGQTWQFAYSGYKWIDLRPENRTYAYLSEAIDDTDEILVATSVDYHGTHPDIGLTLNCRTVNVYKIELSTLQLLSTQVIPTEGKPYLKDMVFIPNNETLNIVTNVQIGDMFGGFPYCCAFDIDIIYNVSENVATLYSADYTIPNGSQEWLHLMNAIERYDSDYYIVAGKYKDDNLYLFDKYTLSASTDCYQTYYAKVFLDPSLPITSSTYQFYPSNKLGFTSKGSISSTSYNTICQ